MQDCYQQVITDAATGSTATYELCTPTYVHGFETERPVDRYTQVAVLVALIWLVVQSMLTRRAVQTTITDEEKLMATGNTGLQNLQALQAQFDAFSQQEDADVQALTTAVTQAIALLGASEDPQVQLAVTAMQATLAKVQAQDATIQANTAGLAAAENPPGQGQTQQAIGAGKTNAPPPPNKS